MAFKVKNLSHDGIGYTTYVTTDSETTFDATNYFKPVKRIGKYELMLIVRVNSSDVVQSTHLRAVYKSGANTVTRTLDVAK